MAEVFRARSLKDPGTPVVVIKKIRPHLSENPAFQRMFMDEARIAAALQHPNIARLLDLGRMDGNLFIALEYVRGLDLETILTRARATGTQIPLDLAIHITMEILKALHHAHTRRGSDGKPMGIVHRDVAPGNVLVSRSGDVKLTDFGLAKAAVRGAQTLAGVVKGNVKFMAPEQIYGSQVDARTDVYGAGMLLFTLLAGKSPFEEDPVPVILEKIVKGEMPVPSAMNPDVPAALDQVVERATKIAPRLRYLSAEELAAALEEIVRDHRLEPRVESLAELVAALETGSTSAKQKKGQSIVGRLGPLIAESVEEGGSGDVLTTLGRMRMPVPTPTNSSMIGDRVPFSPEQVDTEPGEKSTARPSSKKKKKGTTGRSKKSDLGLSKRSRALARGAGTIGSHKQAVAAVAISPNGLLGFSAGQDQVVHVWDLVGREKVRTLAGHTAAITCMAIASSGTQLATGSRDKTVRVWDAATGDLLGTMTGHTGWVFAVAISPDDKKVLSGSFDRTVRVWDLKWRTPIATLEGHKDSVSAVAFSADGRWAISGSYDRSVKTWDLSKLAEVRSFAGSMDSIRAAALSPDGATALAASADSTIRLWDLTWGTEVLALEGHKEPVVAVAFTPDGGRALSGSYDGTIRLWSIADGRLLDTMDVGEPVLALAVSPDGTFAISGGADGAVAIWEIPE